MRFVSPPYVNNHKTISDIAINIFTYVASVIITTKMIDLCSSLVYIEFIILSDLSMYKTSFLKVSVHIYFVHHILFKVSVQIYRSVFLVKYIKYISFQYLNFILIWKILTNIVQQSITWTYFLQKTTTWDWQYGTLKPSIKLPHAQKVCNRE